MSPLSGTTPGFAEVSQRKRKAAPTSFIVQEETSDAEDSDAEDSDSDASLFEVTPLKKPATKNGPGKHVMSKKGLQPEAPVAEPRELFTKLPGEVKNVIYDLVLLEDDPIYVGKRRLTTPHESVWREHLLEKGKRRRRTGKSGLWREPSLLRVSKDIRKEASNVYYSANTFHLHLEVEWIEKACAWLVAKHNLYQPTVARAVFYDDGIGKRQDIDNDELGWFDFTLNFTSGNWPGIRSWFCLTKFAYHITAPDFEYDEIKSVWDRRLFAGSGSENLGTKLREAVLLGSKAKVRGLDASALRVDFEEWISCTRSASHVRPKHFRYWDE